MLAMPHSTPPVALSDVSPVECAFSILGAILRNILVSRDLSSSRNNVKLHPERDRYAEIYLNTSEGAPRSPILLSPILTNNSRRKKIRKNRLTL